MESVEVKIKKTRVSRRLSYIVLCAGLVLVTVVIGVRATYSPGVYYTLALVQFSVICIAAWKVGVSAVRAEPEERRKLAVAGGLLVIPWALFSLFPGIGAPPQATATENQVRYLIVAINAIAIAGGLVVLRQVLSEAGERFWSTLGFAATMLAGPLFVVIATERIGAYGAMVRAGSLEESPEFAPLHLLSHVLLILGAALTYLAVAAFAASLRRTQWLGRTASRVCVGISFFAVSCLAVAMAATLESPEAPMSGIKNWLATLGPTVFMIPAVPAVSWIMPLLFGVLLLRRAGKA